MFLLPLLVIPSVLCIDIPLEAQKNARPGHLELDPIFQKRFPELYQHIPSNPHIVGGVESIPHSRPYQVGIYIPTILGTSFCGGSLIHNRAILTAAHCVDQRIGAVTFHLGTHNMPPQQSDNATTLQSNDIIIHPQWNRSTLMNDIALVRLPTPVPINERINVVPLPRDNSQDYLNNASLVSGWGRFSDQSFIISPVLREVSSFVISNLACRLGYLGTVDPTHICISGAPGSTCNGDSGGPLVVNGIQVGVVSFGTSLGCEVGWPAVFARTTSYLAWINQSLPQENQTSLIHNVHGVDPQVKLN